MKLNNKIVFLSALLLCLGSFTQVVAADELSQKNVAAAMERLKAAQRNERSKGFIHGMGEDHPELVEARKAFEQAQSESNNPTIEAATTPVDESLSADDGYVTADDGSHSDTTLSHSDSGDAIESSSMKNADEALEVATDQVVAAPVDNGAEAATAQLGEAAEDDSNTEAAIEAGDVNVESTEDPVLGEEAAGLKATLSAKLNGAKVFVTTNVAALWAAVKSPKTSIIDPAISYTKNNPYRVVPVAGGVAIVTGAGVYFYVYPNEWTKFKSWVKEKAAYVTG